MTIYWPISIFAFETIVRFQIEKVYIICLSADNSGPGNFPQLQTIYKVMANEDDWKLSDRKHF